LFAPVWRQVAELARNPATQLRPPVGKPFPARQSPLLARLSQLAAAAAASCLRLFAAKLGLKVKRFTQRWRAELAKFANFAQPKQEQTRPPASEAQMAPTSASASQAARYWRDLHTSEASCGLRASWRLATRASFARPAARNWSRSSGASPAGKPLCAPLCDTGAIIELAPALAAGRPPARPAA